MQLELNHASGDKDEKEEVKLSLFAYDRLLSEQNCKDATRKLLELISEVGTVEEYKINEQKSLHLYTLTTQDQKDKLRKYPGLPLQHK